MAPAQHEDFLKNEAVTMMKQGRPPEAVHAHLMWRGLDGFRAKAMIDHLIDLKRQAEAQDPNRLREEAKWMLFQGATIEQVVHRFVSVGIAADAARPEVEKIAAAVREMKPCDRCRSPSTPKDLYFDSAGSQICKRCRAIDDIGNAEHRVLTGALEMAGVPAFALQSASQHQRRSLSVPPFCRTCGINSGVHVNALHPAQRAHVHPGWQYVCHRCLQGVC